jgi:DNA-binding NtrC family response regulator
MGTQQYTVLVVDDESAMREYVRFFLEKKGLLVFEANDGNDAIALAMAHPPDLIITDLVMPGKEGIETIRDIKSRFPLCGIIAMSGAINAETYLSMAQCLGAHTVLQKPFEREALETAVEEALAKPKKGKKALAVR